MKKLASLVGDLAQLDTRKAGYICLLSFMFVMNVVNYFSNDQLASYVGFGLLALGIFLIFAADRNIGKFYKMSFVFAGYHLFDELIGRACKVDVFEYILATITIYYFYGRNRS